MLSHDDLSSSSPPRHIEQSAQSPVADDAAITDGPSTSEVRTEDQGQGTLATSYTPDHQASVGNKEDDDRRDLTDQKKARYLGPNGGIIELEHHAGSVTALAYSPNGRHVAGGTDDALVVIWDANSGRRIHTCQWHSETVCALAFAPNSKRLVSGSGDGLAVVWDVETGREVVVLAGHVSTVYCVAYSPDGAIIATGSVDASVKIWDAASGGAFVAQWP